MTQLTAKVLNRDDFARYGDVLEATGEPAKLINQGKCARFHDLANIDFADDGKIGISLFQSEIFTLPMPVTIMERHPLGSQAFLPVSQTQFLVVVADDNNGTPENLQAFITKPGQGINIHRNVWHTPLCPLQTEAGGCGLFTVVDWIGTRDNLEEYYFDTPYHVTIG